MRTSPLAPLPGLLVLSNAVATLQAADPVVLRAGLCLLVATAAGSSAVSLAIGWFARR